MSGIPDIVVIVASRQAEAGTSFGGLNCQTLRQFPIKTQNPAPLLKLAFSHHQKLSAECLTPSFNSCAYNTDHLNFFSSIADFGDFNRYDSQEFLQKFVLFPIVSL